MNRYIITLDCNIQAVDDKQAIYLGELLKKKINAMNEIDVNNVEVLKIELQNFGSLEAKQVFPKREYIKF